MKKAIEVIFSTRDEHDFSQMLLDAFPGIVFVETNAWMSAEPPTCRFINHCRTAFCGIWNRDLYESLEYVVRPGGGGFLGPSSGPVIQFLRSRISGDVIQAGRMAAGMNNDYPKAAEMVGFIHSVWKIAKKFAPTRVDHVNPSDNSIITPRPPGFLVGPDAAAWCSADEHRYFKCWANTWFLRPCREQKSAEPRKARTK